MATKRGYPLRSSQYSQHLQVSEDLLVLSGGFLAFSLCESGSSLSKSDKIFGTLSSVAIMHKVLWQKEDNNAFKLKLPKAYAVDDYFYTGTHTELNQLPYCTGLVT